MLLAPRAGMAYSMRDIIRSVVGFTETGRDRAAKKAALTRCINELIAVGVVDKECPKPNVCKYKWK